MARKYGVTASTAVRREVSRLIRELGIGETAQRLGIGIVTVGRLASGSAVQRATLALVESKLSSPSQTASASQPRTAA